MLELTEVLLDEFHDVLCDSFANTVDQSFGRLGPLCNKRVDKVLRGDKGIVVGQLAGDRSTGYALIKLRNRGEPDHLLLRPSHDFVQKYTLVLRGRRLLSVRSFGSKVCCRSHVECLFFN